MNVRLEIDDFGTGYSSLSRLQRLPFDSLKIDRYFMSEQSTGNDGLDILKAILQLAHSLRLEVISLGLLVLALKRDQVVLGVRFRKIEPASGNQIFCRSNWIIGDLAQAQEVRKDASANADQQNLALYVVVPRNGM